MRPESDDVKPYPACPDPGLWVARDSTASEIELGDFLYGLVRLIKPKTVLETGCYLGDTSVRIAQALKKNGYGMLMTCDIEPDRVARTKYRLSGFPGEVFCCRG